MKKLIKKILLRTPKSKLLFYKIRVVREKIALNKYNDLQYIKTVNATLKVYHIPVKK